MRIAIAGAGIGGLSFALLAAADGHAVTLFERFVTPRPVGSGLVIQPVGLAVLDLLGAGAQARALSSPISRMYGDAGRAGARARAASSMSPIQRMRRGGPFSALLTPMYQSDSRILPWLRDHLLAPLATWPLVRGSLSHLVAGDLLPPLAGTRLP
ncbi:hypothetical protein [Paracoccus cavernae]|uniref:hypothetical protein n=1 Tax=Paracoccus cavernae TaxID=1571207 RepID=UPI00362CD58A